MKDDFYVYAHYDNSGACRYIGKGSLNRAWAFHQRSKAWNDVFSTGLPEVRILEKNMTEIQAFEREAFYVSEFLKADATLTNIAAGGENCKNVWDERSRALLSEMRSGDKHWNYGKTHSEETRRRIAATKQANPETSIARPWLGKKRDPELIKKLVDASHTPSAIAKSIATRKENGWSPSEEQRRKVSERLTGIPRTEETKMAISAAKKGRPNGLSGRVMPEEHRRKISDATMGRRPLTAEEQSRRLATWKARGGTTSKAKKVLCVETNKTFRCAKDAATALDCSDKHIQACCTGRRQKHAGYSWRYI